MGLLLTSLLVASGVLLGRWIARGGRSRDRALPSATKPDVLASSDQGMANKGMPPKKVHDWSAFPCALGDVVARPGSEERWLAGALVFSEDRPAAALFVAPEAGGDRAVFARPRPNDALLWLDPLARDELAVGAEPPTSLEVRGLRYERIRRLPLRVERVGAGAPDLGDSAIVAEYASGGAERLLLVIGGGTARAWRGVSLDPGMYDVMPSGSSTLDPP